MSDRRPLLALLVMSGPAQGQKLVLDHSFLLGRDTTSKLTLNDERVSRHHAMVEMTDGKPILRDLGSKNGTFVNGAELKGDHLLRTNDRVRVGKTLMAVVPHVAETEETRDKREDRPGTASQADGTVAARRSTPPPATGQINRKLLRRATEMAGKVSDLMRDDPSLGGLAKLLAAEIGASAVAVFPIAPPAVPFLVQGEPNCFHPMYPTFEQWLAQPNNPATLLDAHPPTADLPLSGQFLALVVRGREGASVAMMLHRPPPSCFIEEEVHLADALVECLRIVPLQPALEGAAAAQPSSPLALLIGNSECMEAVRDQIRQFAPTSSTVLLLGESGTGKELCARAIAQLSQRAGGPYLELNAACMMPDLIESELFGHEMGAFTGADRRKLGKLEMADGGTLFLDEIGELPLELQARVLRVLEGQPFYRVGGSKTVFASVRFICATNRDLEKMVAEGTFRRDLYHRINILKLELPALRNRREDIPDLVHYFLRALMGEMALTREFTLSPRALRRMLAYDWPGNVRELRNVLQRMMVLSPDPLLDEQYLPREIREQHDSTTMKLPRLQVLTEMIEREEISRALLEANGHKSNAAKLLGISRPTLDKKIKLYGFQQLVHSRSDDEDEEA